MKKLKEEQWLALRRWIRQHRHLIADETSIENVLKQANRVRMPIKDHEAGWRPLKKCRPDVYALESMMEKEGVKLGEPVKWA